MATSAAPEGRRNRIWNELCQLKSMEPTSTAPGEFILDQSPFKVVDDDDDIPATLPSDEVIIIGRLLPKKPPFDRYSLPVKIALAKDYPLTPPKIFMLKETYHPNVDKDGELCVPLSDSTGKGTYKPVTMLKEIIIQAIAAIDEPNSNYFKHPEAAQLYQNNRDEFNRIATTSIEKHRSPRCLKKN